MLLLTTWTFWHWWIIAGLLIIVELLAGLFFFWIGLAALFTGGIAWLFPSMDWRIELAIFSLFSAISVYLGRQFLTGDAPPVNLKAERFLGRKAIVVEAIEAGQGKIKLGGTVWIARGPDCPEGTHVVVRQAIDTVLKVELLNDELE